MSEKSLRLDAVAYRHSCFYIETLCDITLAKITSFAVELNTYPNAWILTVFHSRYIYIVRILRLPVVTGIKCGHQRVRVYFREWEPKGKGPRKTLETVWNELWLAHMDAG